MSGPTLPINIEIDSNIFPKDDKSPVIPVDIPPFPNADTASNKIFKNNLSSVKFKIITDKNTQITASITIENALVIVLKGIVLLNALTCLLFRK